MYDGDAAQVPFEDRRREGVPELLARVIGAAAVSELEVPHIVVCRDHETGVVTYSGPFPDAVAALVFAERERVLDGELNSGAPLGFGIAALFPGADHDAR